MNWVQLSLLATADQVGWIEERLNETGAVSVTLSEAEDQPIYEPAPGETPLWNKVLITGLYNDDRQPEEILEHLGEDPALTPWRYELLEDRVWEREWLQHFQPLRINEKLMIWPGEEAPPADSGTVLRLDPGLAFGTGSHATTSLCLDWLSENCEPGMTTLDFGCGSGILAIAALLLGARYATAVDIDPQALVATRANAERNGITIDRLMTLDPETWSNSPHHTRPVDLVVANILAQPLIDLEPILRAQLAEGGKLLLSGILTEQCDAVVAAYSGGLRLIESVEMDGWVRLVFSTPDQAQDEIEESVSVKNKNNSKNIDDNLYDAIEPAPIEFVQHSSKFKRADLLIALCAIALVALLAAQFMWQQRMSLAQNLEWRPWLEKMCGVLTCDVPAYYAPQRIRGDQLTLQSNETNPEILDVQMSLTNLSPFAQALPLLELSFYDVDGALLARRQFSADEYLANGSQPPLLNPGVPVNVAMQINDPGEEAINYRVRLF